MRKMFTKLFGLALLMFLFSAVTVVKAQVIVEPTDCGPTITKSDVELVTPLNEVCDSANIEFKIVGYPGAKFAYNYDGSGAFVSEDSTFSIQEGKWVWLQVVVDDTCVSNALHFNSNVVDSITILEPHVESPLCGGTDGSITINYEGGYVSDYGVPADPYKYQVVPEGVWVGPQNYPGYIINSRNAIRETGTFYVAVYDNKSTPCLADLTNIAAWDTAVINPASPEVMIDTIYGSDPMCNGADGTVTVEVSGGTPWSSGEYQVSVGDSMKMTTGQEATFMMPDGEYQAYVVDSLGCDATSDSTVVLTEPEKVNFDVAIKSVDCFGGNNGEITVVIDTAISDPANDYEVLVVSIDTSIDNNVYTWQSMGATDSITIENLYPTYYALFVRDATNGCDSVPYVNPNSSNNYITLQTPGELTWDLVFENDMDSIPCHGDSIWVSIENIEGGSGHYKVRLNYPLDHPSSPGALTTFNQDVEKWLLPAGTDYKVIVRDSLVEETCQESEFFTITGNDPINIEDVNTTNPLCPGQDDGTIEIIADGGTGVYEYSIDSVNWYPDNVFNRPAGEYTAYVRDVGCPNSIDYETVSVEEDANIIAVDYSESDTLICTGSTEGSIWVDRDSWNVSGPGLETHRKTKAYYTTDLDSVYVSGTEMDKNFCGHGCIYWTAEELSAGTYYIWAVDTFGCVFDADIDGTPDYLTVNVREFEDLQLFVDLVDSATCAGANDGLVTLTKAGGDTTYMSGPDLVIEKSANIAYSNFYYGIAASYQQALLKTPGSMTNWPEGVDEVNMNVTGGLHYFILYDASCGNRVIVEKDIAGHGAVKLEEDSIKVKDIVCYGEAKGEIKINAATGGSGTLVYTLYEGGMTMADTVEGYVEVTDTVFSDLVAGDYYIGVTDMGPDDCAGYWTEMIPVTQPDLDFSIEAFDITCNGNADGLLVLTMEGAGASTPVFKLGASNWKPFDTYDEGTDTWTKNVNILEPGDYVVSAIDSVGHATGCDGMAIPFTIIEPPVLTVNVEGMDSTACSIVDDGYITITVDGGKLSVDTFEVQVAGVDTALIARDSVLVLQGIAEGSYEIVVTEVASGLVSPCVMTDSVDVTPPPVLEAEADEYMKMLACKSDSNGVITLDISGGSGIYKVWVNSVLAELDANNAITGLPAGFYAIVVADSIPMAGADSACTVTLDTVIIDEPDSYLELDATKIQDVSCQEDGMFSVQASGGTPGYKYYAALSAFPKHTLLPEPNSVEWQTDSIFTVTEPGTWVVWVMDAAGCIVGGEYDRNDHEINKWRVPIGEPEVQISVAAMKADPKCNGDFGMVVVEPDSVTVTENDVAVDRAYTVWFENLAGDTIVENDTLQMTITDTTYVIAMVKDNESGCTGVDTVMLTQPDPLSADALVIADGEFTCPSITEGYLEAMASGGTKPYKFQIWQNGAKKADTYYNNNSFLAKVNNEYSFVVKDANGCTDTLDVPVFVNSVDSVKIVDIKDVSCTGDADSLASVMIEITGEADHFYKVIWTQLEAESGVYSDSASWYSPGKIYLYQKFKFDNENFNDIHYEFTVVDSFGCATVAKDTMTFDQRPTSDLTLTVTEGDMTECSADFMISAAGGVAPYTFIVDDTLMVEAGTITLGRGAHMIAVADAHECMQEQAVEVMGMYVTRDTTINTYIDEKTEFVDTEAGLDTMLAVGTYTFMYTVDCERTLNVTVVEIPRPYTIADVQGDENSSPIEGKIAQVTGTVTGVVEGEGFYMQDGNEPNSGLWVEYSDVTNDGIQIGDGVVVVGTVAEVAQVTTIQATDVTMATDATPEITPVSVTPTEAQDEMYESMLVTVLGGRATALDEGNGEWTVYYEPIDFVTINDLMYSSTPVEGDFYNVTGVVNGRLDAFKVEPRMESDIVDLKDTPVDPEFTNTFRVYPNPFNDKIYIDNNDKLVRVVITNIAGQRVLDVKYPKREIRTANLVSGVYLVNMFTESGLAKTDRIVKR